MIVVLDTSVGVSVALKRPEAAGLVEILADAEHVIAPDLYISEAANTFWKYVQFKQLVKGFASLALDHSLQLVDAFHDSLDFYQEVFAFACDHHHTVYDALYLILARRNNATLLTLDKKLAKLATGNHISILP